jgi:fructan beta-fructosidase
MPFNQQVTFPRELTLRTTAEGPRLFREPVQEIASLRGKERNWAGRSLSPGETWSLDGLGELLDIKLDARIPDRSSLTLNIAGAPLELGHHSLACGSAQQKTIGEVKTVEVLLDRTSIEAFGNGGEVSVSRCFLPAGNSVSLTATGPGVELREIRAYPLKSVWPTIRRR